MDQAFNFNINTNYGSVSGMEDLEVQKQNQESNKKSYSGYYLKPGTANYIEIRTNYASVNLQQK